MSDYVVFPVSQTSDDFGCSLLSLADCPAFLSCSVEIQALVDDLGLVPGDSPQGIALSCYGSRPRLCDVYRAKAKLYDYYRMKEFFAGCGKYRRVRPDHSRELTLF